MDTTIYKTNQTGKSWLSLLIEQKKFNNLVKDKKSFYSKLELESIAKIQKRINQVVF